METSSKFAAQATTRAMDASDGMFAYYLFGIMKAAHSLGMITPDPEAEAREYLKKHYPCAPEQYIRTKA